VKIPQLGFGTFQIPPEETAEAVGSALAVGYRHVDTAAAYRNERGVGEGLRASGVPRDEVYVTTKCWNSQQGRDEARRACERSLEKLGMDYVDLYLIHWPLPSRDLYLETWETFMELECEGLAKQIGVSNFQPEHLDRIVEATGVIPAVNQIEVHPYFANEAARAATRRHGALVEAWSPLGQGGGELTDEVVVRIAQEHGKTPAQVLLRWQLDRGDIVFPKSMSRDRLAENAAIFDFALSDAEVAELAALDKGPAGRQGPDPEVFDWIP